MLDTSKSVVPKSLSLTSIKHIIYNNLVNHNLNYVNNYLKRHNRCREIVVGTANGKLHLGSHNKYNLKIVMPNPHLYNATKGDTKMFLKDFANHITIETVLGYTYYQLVPALITEDILINFFCSNFLSLIKNKQTEQEVIVILRNHKKEFANYILSNYEYFHIKFQQDKYILICATEIFAGGSAISNSTIIVLLKKLQSEYEYYNQLNYHNMFLTAILKTPHLNIVIPANNLVSICDQARSQYPLLKNQQITFQIQSKNDLETLIDKLINSSIVNSDILQFAQSYQFDCNGYQTILNKWFIFATKHPTITSITSRLKLISQIFAISKEQ